MTNTPVAASGPLEFTDGGAQFVIPLSSLYFDATGALKTDSPFYDKHKAQFDGWLGYLKRQGIVSPAPQPPPAPAMVISAKDAGAAGNNIELTFSNLREDPAVHYTVFDVSLTETDTYAGLTPETVKDVLGTTAGGGSKPGLVFVSSAGAPTQPADGVYPIPVGGPPFTVDISDGGGGVAFTVRSKADQVVASNTTVEIKDAADPLNPDTFTLVATWTSGSNGIGPGDLGGSFAYEITVDPPPGGTLRAPAAGTVTLRGGSDASGPTHAAVTVSAAS